MNDGNSHYLEVVDNLSGGWGYVEWDSFSVPYQETVVPEPSTFLICTVGLLGLALWAGRRRSRCQDEKRHSAS